MTSTALSAAALQQLRNVGGDALVRRMIRLFMTTAEDAITHLHASVSAAEFPIVASAAHYLYASASQMSISRVAEASARLEKCAHAADIAGTRAAFADLSAAYQEAQPELNQLLATLPRPPRIAIIDDSEDVRLLLRLLLEPLYDVTEYVDAGTALRSMLRTPPDLAIIDMTLPDISGLELLELMQASGILSNVPAVALTAMNLPEGQSYVDRGFSLHVRKPILETDEFVATLGDLLRNYARDA